MFQCVELQFLFRTCTSINSCFRCLRFPHCPGTYCTISKDHLFHKGYQIGQGSSSNAKNKPEFLQWPSIFDCFGQQKASSTSIEYWELEKNVLPRGDTFNLLNILWLNWYSISWFRDVLEFAERGLCRLVLQGRDWLWISIRRKIANFTSCTLKVILIWTFYT